MAAPSVSARMDRRARTRARARLLLPTTRWLDSARTAHQSPPPHQLPTRAPRLLSYIPLLLSSSRTFIAWPSARRGEMGKGIWPERSDFISIIGRTFSMAARKTCRAQRCPRSRPRTLPQPQGQRDEGGWKGEGSKALAQRGLTTCGSWRMLRIRRIAPQRIVRAVCFLPPLIIMLTKRA